jgi:hypothetical protein
MEAMSLRCEERLIAFVVETLSDTSDRNREGGSST